MLSPGTIVGGYRIEQLVAAGGMGTVYRATQISLGRTVALKLLSDDLGRETGFEARFRREAVLQATLEHPHIVPVYEAGESPHGLYIAMRFIEGSNLEQLAAHATRREMLAVLRGVAAALDAAHAAGLVHRDLKPQNILVAGDHAYLADFGLTAGAGLSSMTSAGQFVGTPDYVSPEQIRDEEPDARSDIYSFGAVLYRCLTGSVPFPRATRVATIYAQLEQQPEPASAVAPELPPAVDVVLARALAKDPAQRQASAGELVAAARQALERGAPDTLEHGPSAPSQRGLTRTATTTTAAHSRSAGARIRSAAVPGRGGAVAGDPVRRRGGAVAGAALLMLIVAAIGAAAGVTIRRGSAVTPALGATRALAADGASVSVPAGWERRTIALPELFGRPFAAAGPPGAPDAGVAVGLTRGFGPSLVPTPLRTVPGTPASGPAVATPAGRQGRLYRFTGPQRRYEILFVPTGHLVATAACTAPRGGPAGRLFSDCERILATLDDANALPLDPRAAYARFMTGVLTTLSERERNGVAQLDGAAGASAQAAAATAVAGAFTAAEQQIKGLVGHGLSAPEVGVHFGVRDKLGEVADAYRALAAAARAHDAGAWRTAAAQISSARGDLSARLYELEHGGYTFGAR